VSVITDANVSVERYVASDRRDTGSVAPHSRWRSACKRLGRVWIHDPDNLE
jgi:hypothetical protein